MAVLYFRKQVTRFVILMHGRTGSTYLVNAINSHPDVRARGEKLVSLRAEGPEAQFRRIRSLLSPPPLGPWAAIGFKTKLSDVLDPAGFRDILIQSEAKIILLQRRNLVKWAVSFLNFQRVREMSGKGHLYDERDRLGPLTIGSAGGFSRMLEHIEGKQQAMETFMHDLPAPPLRLYYEELLLDPDDVFRRAFEFLRVPNRTVRGKTIKISGDDLKRSVANFAEIRSHFVGTPYEPMFDEVLVSSQS